MTASGGSARPPRRRSPRPPGASSREDVQLLLTERGSDHGGRRSIEVPALQDEVLVGPIDEQSVGGIARGPLGDAITNRRASALASLSGGNPFSVHELLGAYERGEISGNRRQRRPRRPVTADSSASRRPPRRRSAHSRSWRHLRIRRWRYDRARLVEPAGLDPAFASGVLMLRGDEIGFAVAACRRQRSQRWLLRSGSRFTPASPPPS